MATTTRYPIRIPLRLPRPIEPTELPASKPHRPQTPNLPPTLHTSAPCFRSNQRQPTRSNLHSLNSWPAVQCNEGFCNAPQSQCFTLTRPRRRRNLTIPRIVLLSLPALRCPEGEGRRARPGGYFVRRPPPFFARCEESLPQLVTQRARRSPPVSLSLSSSYISSVRAAFGGKANTCSM